MRFILFAAAVLALALAAPTQRELFDKFKHDFNRNYSGEEDKARFECFKTVLKLIDERNAEGKGDNPERHGINEFADMCPDEFVRTMNGLKLPDGWTHPEYPVDEKVEKLGAQGIYYRDWRTQGAVTPIKNQGRCGSCWSFSATGNMEGQWAINKGHLIGLSEEELVSCDGTCHGCRGGLMPLAFKWVIANGGLDTERTYPYNSGGGYVGSCRRSLLHDGAINITSWENLPHSEHGVGDFCADSGPVSIGVDASRWQTYQGGVVTGCTGRHIDHGVLLVGFNLRASTPYWIVKNSWGTTWGEEGYIYLEVGSNQCGMLSTPSTSRV
eukprot:NODE_1003_length_1069_cov_64.255839_g959_i0.p1 GENE.NODE_1003_length_1069_cov_64.255839_g959_i0~~NODE_1003_length_1069_cov_64.255839_g959_i0.p1  ORF type:complete len:351 (-),score=98.20 NODE_1003_length_1069_cov_64.255839_g959_i0:17-994(-)